MKVKSESEVVQSCPNRSDPMDGSLPGSSAHGIFQARVLEWVAIAFSIPRTKSLLISLLQSLSAVTLEPKKIKSVTVSIFPHLFEVKGQGSMILVFLMLTFKPAFSLSSFTFIKRLFSSLLFLALGWYLLHI